MKWTKQRKITGAILTLAGMGFGVDQLFFSGGPESADAAAQTAAAAPAPAAKGGPTVAAGGTTHQPAALLARRLEQASSVAGHGSTGDAFRPPASWYPKPEAPKATTKTTTAEKPQVEAGIQFKAKHRLIGVMRSGPAGSKQGLAVIAGPSGSLTVRVGETIDGVKLTAVEDGSIRMIENGQEFSVELPRPGLGSTAVAQ